MAIGASTIASCGDRRFRWTTARGPPCGVAKCLTAASEPGPPIPVGEEQAGVLSGLNARPQRREHPALEVQAVGFQGDPLAGPAGPLTPAGHAPADRHSPLRGGFRLARNAQRTPLGAVPLPGHGAPGREGAVAVRCPQRRGRAPHAGSES